MTRVVVDEETDIMVALVVRAAALTRIRTWSANIFGLGTSTTSRTSGPPKLR